MSKESGRPPSPQPATGDVPGAVLIIGLGNPLRGDDGIGPRVVEALNHYDLPAGVVVLDAGTGGIGLLHKLEGWDRVVVVDAADMGHRPGAFVRFAPAEVRLATAEDTLSFHHAGLPEVLTLAHALDRPLPPITVFGVQPEQVDWREGLSPAVGDALPKLVEVILREVGEDNVQDSDH